MNGTIEVGFKSQKHFIGFYVLKGDVVDKHGHRMKDAGKGAIRFKPVEIDFELVSNLLEDTVRSAAGICD